VLNCAPETVTAHIGDERGSAPLCIRSKHSHEIALFSTARDLYMQGRFPFDKLIKMYPFEQINVADSERGVTIKPVIRITAEA